TTQKPCPWSAAQSTIRWRNAAWAASSITPPSQRMTGSVLVWRKKPAQSASAQSRRIRRLVAMRKSAIGRPRPTRARIAGHRPSLQELLPSEMWQDRRIIISPDDVHGRTERFPYGTVLRDQRLERTRVAREHDPIRHAQHRIVRPILPQGRRNTALPGERGDDRTEIDEAVADV